MSVTVFAKALLSSAVAVLAVAVLAVGCTAPVRPFDLDSNRPPVDMARFDAGPRVDAEVGPVDADIGPVDAFAMDAAVVDGGSVDGGDAAASMDVGQIDSARDLGPDTSACRLADGAYDLCACGPFGQDCSAAACPASQSCVSDRCGRHCVPSGSACTVPGDCPAGTMCVGGTCARGATCTDSRTCPLGFACETGACVDRRFPCSTDGDCPFGYACDTALSRGTCVRVSRPCATDAACTGTFAARQVCVDIDGDGNTECQFAGGPCTTNRDCTGVGQVCTPHALTNLSVCGRFGPCTAVSRCVAGMDCRDLWGDGVRECVMTGGCTNSAACPVNQVCATPNRGGPPTCQSRG